MHRDEVFIEEVESILKGNILAFWQSKMVDPRGGFYGRVLSDGSIDTLSDKGAVLNARILWSFSSAYIALGDDDYLSMATRAKEFLVKHLYDHTNGGLFWSATHDGKPSDSKKQFYALGFAIYGLSEYYRATGDEESLEYAMRLYQDIERHSYDSTNGGYIEAKGREWSEIEDLRLSAKDANSPFTMNTHLHIIEPYTNLYRVAPSDELRERIENLINIFLDKIYKPQTGHLGLFFDKEWNLLDDDISYGHDIEASWLLLEAAQVIEDATLEARIVDITAKIARAASEGLQSDGSMIYERRGGGVEVRDRHWWVQAEAIVGYVWLAKYHGDKEAMARATSCWEYVKHNLIDYTGGEWWWSTDDDGKPDYTQDKAGIWKCPYHNTRMCLEVIKQLKMSN